MTQVTSVWQWEHCPCVPRRWQMGHVGMSRTVMFHLLVSKRVDADDRGLRPYIVASVYYITF